MAFLAELTKGGMEGIFSGVKDLISQFHTSPEEKQKALQAVMNYEVALFEAASKLDLAQLEINKIEAASSSRLVSGWRPMLGWVCVAGFSYEVIVQPIFNWFVSTVGFMAGMGLPLLPSVDSAILTTTLFGMLGMAANRTYEKIRGVARS